MMQPWAGLLARGVRPLAFLFCVVTGGKKLLILPVPRYRNSVHHCIDRRSDPYHSERDPTPVACHPPTVQFLSSEIRSDRLVHHLRSVYTHLDRRVQTARCRAVLLKAPQHRLRGRRCIYSRMCRRYESRLQDSGGNDHKERCCM